MFDLKKPNGLKVRRYIWSLYFVPKARMINKKKIKGTSVLLVSSLVISIKYRWHNIASIAEYECQF